MSKSDPQYTDPSGDGAPIDVLFRNCRMLSTPSVDDAGTGRAVGDRSAHAGAHSGERALAIRGDRILAVGDLSDVRGLLAPDHLEVDAGGATVLPAFHDSHVHLGQHGLELSQVDLHGAHSLEEGLRRVERRATQSPAGSWILGAGFALQRWGVASLDRAMLDKVAPEHPVLLRSQDHHSAWVNSLALRLAGIDAATEDPPGGSIVHDNHGEPTGMLLERALHLVWDLVPPPTAEELSSAVHGAAEDLASRGIATVHHMAYEPASHWREIALAAGAASFPLRVWACLDQENIEHAASIGLATGQGSGNFRIGGAKFFADGALGSRTAWMLDPYLGTSDCGVAVHGPEILAQRYPLAIEHGLVPVTHAIGDAAVRAVLDALEATAPLWRARGMRPRIEHVQHITREDVRRLSELGVTASMQPNHLPFDVPSIKALLADRQERAYPMASLLRSGVPLSLGSDTPVASPEVLEGMRAACSRTGVDGDTLCPDEALSVSEAIRGYTEGAAYAIGAENRSGRLAPGFDADLVFLSGNPLDSLDDIAVVATVKGGVPTYDPQDVLSVGYTRV